MTTLAQLVTTIILVFLSLSSCWANNSVATKRIQDRRAPAEELEKIGSELTYVVVSKESLQADVRTLPEKVSDEKVIRSFPIALGKELGDKLRAGDNKTPEGIYLAKPQITIRDQRLKQSKYGAYAIPLDYPNPIDRLQKKTGSGIWLHGAGQDSRIEKANVTEGCVAFYNHDIEWLTKWIKSTSSLIVISQKFEQVNEPQLWTEIHNMTDQWMKAWDDRNLDKYVSFYSDDFHFKGMNRKQFHKYKQAVFKKYKRMSVEMENIRVITHPKYAVSIMIQNFRGDRSFVTRGRKILYWLKDQNGDWRIAFERFEPNSFEKLKFPGQLADY